MMRARVTLAIFLVVPAAFAWACGGDGNVDTDGGSDSGGNDGTLGNDTGKNDASNDSSSNDTGATDGGTTDTGTTDGGGFDASAFTCTKPSDCTNQFCCGTIVFNGGTIPNCNLASAGSACAATCVSDIKFSCNATDTVRACATNPDCADAGGQYNKCCNVKFGDAAVDFCWNAQLAGAAGGTCQ